MTWQGAIETTVRGLGYELVDAEKSAGGLLRVFIDHPGSEHPSGDQSDNELPTSGGSSALQVGETGGPEAGASPEASVQPERFITVDDCERVTRQLQHVLEVEGCNYARLEVSSPGLDRPLKKAADYRRFVGEQVELTLKLPFQGRKKYRGQLEARGGDWRLVLPEGGGADAAQKALDFDLGEVREARLVPVVDFKGRRFAAPQAAEADQAAAGGATGPGQGGRARKPRAGGSTARGQATGEAAGAENKVDGGRIQ